MTLGDHQGNILDKIRFPTETDKGVDHTLERIYQGVETLGAAYPGSLADPVFGISCGGPLDSKRGLVLSPPNLPGWDGIPITELLEKRFSGRAFLMNDANACALAEWQFGAARGYANAIFLTFGTGMGAGLILNNQLYTGTNDLAGEVGHIRLAESGPMGYGKAGSFESFCSGGGLKNLATTYIQEAWAKGERVGFCPDEGALVALDARVVCQAASEGDRHALEIIGTSAKYLGRGLALLIDLLNPEIIVIGSIYARNEALFYPVVKEVLEEECLPGALAQCQIVPAKLGEQVGDIAAIATAFYGLKQLEA